MSREFKPKLFLSHSGKDNDFVKILAEKLIEDGYDVWYDEWEIKVGDSIVQKINEGISKSDCLIIILSENSINSKWVTEELNAATVRSIESKGVFIFPVLLCECNIPPLLSDKKYADFSKDSDKAYKQLIDAINFNIKIANQTQLSAISFDTINIHSLDLLNTNEQMIEDKIEQFLCQPNYSILIKYALKKEFNKIQAFLKGQEDIASFDQLLNNLTVMYLECLNKLFPIWTIAVEYDNIELGNNLVNEIYELYLKSYDLKINVTDGKSNKIIDYLWINKHIIFLVYCMGAFSIMKNNPKFAILLLNKEDDNIFPYRKGSWLFITFILLSTSFCVQPRIFCGNSFEFARKNQYIFKNFNNDCERLQSSICQFDFLHCFHTLYLDKNIKDCYPGFILYGRQRVEPIIEELMDDKKRKIWFPDCEEIKCARIICSLDNLSKNLSGYSHHWNSNDWNNAKIKEFIEKGRY